MKPVNSPITIIDPKTGLSKTIAPSDSTEKTPRQYNKRSKHKQDTETEKFSINGYCFTVPKK